MVCVVLLVLFDLLLNTGVLAWFVSYCSPFESW